MEALIGDTPIALLILEVALIPLLWWVGSKLNKVLKSVDKCVDALDLVTDTLTKLNGSLGTVREELNQAEIRDKATEGSLKGIHASLARIENKIS